MKTPHKPEKAADLALFKDIFKKHQNLFGLTGYHVYFTHAPLDADFASIEIDLENMTVNASLNSKLPARERPYANIQREARHEAIHLLIGRIVELAKARCIHGAELHEAAEELVHRLDSLLPQVEQNPQ